MSATRAEPRTSGWARMIDMGALEGSISFRLRQALPKLSPVEGGGSTPLNQLPFAILCLVEANPGIDQSAISRALRIKRTNMTILVRDLSDRGLIRREIPATDRRRSELYITAHGSSILSQQISHASRHEAAILARLDPHEVSLLNDILAKISLS